MYGKPTYTKLNSLDMILFHSNINVHQAGYSMLLVASFPPFRALEFLLLAKHRWKRIFKEPISGIQFMNDIVGKLMVIAHRF